MQLFESVFNIVRLIPKHQGTKIVVPKLNIGVWREVSGEYVCTGNTQLCDIGVLIEKLLDYLSFESHDIVCYKSR